MRKGFFNAPLHASVLEGMLQASIQVRDKFGDTALIRDITRHTLCDLDSVRLGEVSRRRGIVQSNTRRAGSLHTLCGVFHCFDRPHSPVYLDSFAFVVEEFTG